MSDEWFRNKDWTPAIEEEFFRKLARARSQKAQYIRIQANYLCERKPEIALSLLEHYFQLNDHFDDAQAFLAQAHAYHKLGDREQAAVSFEKALLREEEFPNLLTQAGFEFPVYVATHQMTGRYEAAIRVIAKYRPKAMLPVQRFCSFVASALIATDTGAKEEGVEFAQAALSVAAMQSPFAHHPGFGLVDDEYHDLKALMQDMCREAMLKQT